VDTNEEHLLLENKILGEYTKQRVDEEKVKEH
jgi:hypothetical protein